MIARAAYARAAPAVRRDPRPTAAITPAIPPPSWYEPQAYQTCIILPRQLLFTLHLNIAVIFLILRLSVWTHALHFAHRCCAILVYSKNTHGHVGVRRDDEIVHREGRRRQASWHCRRVCLRLHRPLSDRVQRRAGPLGCLGDCWPQATVRPSPTLSLS